METTKQIIEINGIKMEVDLREARCVETYKVGDKVKVLKKNYSGYSSFPGVIIGFDGFAQLPTINIAYFERDYNSAKISFLSLNNESKEVEICPMAGEEAFLEKGEVLRQLDKEISKHEADIEDLKARRAYFIEKFGAYFEALVSPTTDDSPKESLQ